MKSESDQHTAERVIGRYVIYDEIASGGMATVHLGRLVGVAGFSRIVAVKRLHPQYAKEPEFVAMFIDEARIAARIHHSNVVTTLEVVALDGELFLIMEFVKGEALSRLIKAARVAKEPVPHTIATGIIAGALHGLHAAHEATGEFGEPLGVVHRDISPQNILVDVNGVPRVLDFGVAKAIGRLQTTQEGQIKGKTAYMAPEQLRGHPVDRRADLFAISVVFWEVLTGKRLFRGDTPGEIMARVIEQPIDPPSQHDASIPSSLDEIVLRGLQRDPAARFQTAEEMAIALEAALPVPSARVVGNWVKKVGGPTLLKRFNRVAEIESSPSASHGARHGAVRPGEPHLPSQVSNISVATPVDAEPASRRRFVLGAVFVAIVGMAGVITWRQTRTTPETSAPSAPTNSAAPSPSDARFAGQPSSTGVTPPPSTASASGMVVSPAPSTVVLPSTIKPRPSQPLPSKPKANCNPPYTVDSDGIHIPKKECK